ncbi:hypothetical protein MMC11_007027 [Xylographa trunciseda]|nr:hypothetical protein [Xylographa trunciseda]
MCFGTKPTPPTRAMSISPPRSLPFDYEKNPLPPWQNPYSTHAIRPVPAPPPKHALTPPSAYTPKAVPAFDLDWRTQPLSPRQQGFARERRGKGLGGAWRQRWAPVRRKLFGNEGLDERGRLKAEYEEVEEPDWGCDGGFEPVRKYSMY